MSIYSPASAGSPSPHNGQDSGRLPSVKSNHSVRKSSRQGSGLLPTPGTPRPHDNEETAGKYYPSQNQWDLTGVIRFSSPTSTPSTEPNSGEQPYLPGEFHASRRPLPGSEKERQMIVGSGRKLLESWPKSSQPGPSLKTLVESLALSTAWYSRTCYLRWRARVTKSGRLLFQLVPSMPRTGEIGSGLLLTTPNVQDDREVPSELRPSRIATGRKTDYLSRQIAMLKTPSSVETEGGVMEIRPGCDGHYKLRDQIAMLPTPKAQNSTGAGEHGQGGRDLQTTVGTSHGLKLQPAFVEWMQGFPIGWTDLKPSAMPSSRKSHTGSLRQSRKSKRTI